MTLGNIGARSHACVFVLVTAVALVASLHSGTGAQDTRADIDFGKNGVGVPPAEFDAWPPGSSQQRQWTVVPDATGTAGLAIEQRGIKTGEDQFPIAIYKSASLKNAEISLRFKVVAGNADQGAGVAVRLTTPDDYYVVQADALRDRVTFSIVTHGRTEEVAGADADIAVKTWHTLFVRAEDERFTISLDGIWLFTVYDANFSRAGRIALWTKADSVTRFDHIAITPLPASERR